MASHIAQAKLNDVEMKGDAARVVQSICWTTSAYVDALDELAEKAADDWKGLADSSLLNLLPTK